MIFPDGANIFSSSTSVRDGGKPLMYKLAPLIPSLLGRAYETCRHCWGLVRILEIVNCCANYIMNNNSNKYNVMQL